MKKLTSLALILALCLSLAVPALAAGETTITDSKGHKYTLSNPLIRTETLGGYTQRFDGDDDAVVYVVSKGTIITPVIPDGVTKDGFWYDMDEAAGRKETGEENGIDFGFTFRLDEPGGGIDGPVWFPAEINAEYEYPYLEAPGMQPLPHYPSRWGYTMYRVTRVFKWGVKAGSGAGVREEQSYLYVCVVEAETSNSSPSGGFTDVKAGDYFYDAVQWAVEKNITKGTSATTFSPDDTCTQAQILTFLWRAKGSPEPKTAPASTDYYAKAAQWAKEQGIVDEFSPNAPCTRAMTVDFLWRAAGKPQTGGKTAFTDVQTGTSLEKAVAWAVQAGVTTGTSKTAFSPNQICSRGQIVTFLYRNLK